MCRPLAVYGDTDTLATLTLLDDGFHHDGSAGDGVYGEAFVQLLDSGVVSFSVTADGAGVLVGSFHREQTLAICFIPGSYQRGDLNGDGIFDVFDVVLLIDHVFRSGLAPIPPQLADVTCDGVANIFDIVRLVDTVFRLAPEPSCP